MKKSVLFALVFVCIQISFAQTIDSVSLGAPSSGSPLKFLMNDSISLGAPSGGISYPNDVFYNMKTGVSGIVSGTNWHIAFATRKASSSFNALQGATILANEGRGVSIFESQQNITNWSNFDTTGYRTWTNPHNSDSTWNIGALNAGRSNSIYDFGWGMYDSTSRSILGSKIFLVRITVGTASTFKKITINSLVGDSQWVFTTANLNNSDSVVHVIRKSTFNGKLFAYHNLTNNTTINREPNGTWDLLFTRYGAFITQFSQTIFSATTGVLSYPTIQTAKVTGVPFQQAMPGGYNSKITTIGTDWKENPGPGQPNFIVKDSITYFVKGADNTDDKLAFTAFRGSSTGVIAFRKEITRILPGFTYPNDVFYSMKDGVVSTTNGTNWHLAFAIRNALPPANVLRSTTILANEGRGVSVFESTQLPQNFDNFDTTGYRTWVNPHNSDSSWDMGALNANRTNDPFDFGWGAYDMTSHDLLGTKVFLIRYTAGNGPSAVTLFKKLMINSLAYDTQWVFTYANIDNSAKRTIRINKVNYAGNLFAYHNLFNDSTFKREPNTKWDLLFTRYGTFITQFSQTIFSTTTGVMQHPSVEVSKVANTPVDSSVAGVYEKDITTIGTDWKENPGPGQPNFIVKDSISYFTKASNGREDKLVFKAFRGSSTGVIVFAKRNVKLEVGLNKIQIANLKGLYPNPSNGSITVELRENIKANLVIMDMTGRELIQHRLENLENIIDISELNQGIYFVAIESNGSKQVVRLVVE